MKHFNLIKLVSVILACALTFAGTEKITGNAEAAALQPASDSEVLKSGADSEAPKPEFSPPDLSDYTLWDGTSELEENTNYYISDMVKIYEGDSFKLPESSTLYIEEKASLRVFIGGAMDIAGTLIIAPRAGVTSSGKFTALKGSFINNYGSFVTTPSSTTDLLAWFTSYKSSTTAFCGTTNVYKEGAIHNYGRATVSKDSLMTLTGVVRSYEGSRLMIDGEIQITLSGRLAVGGIAVLTGSLVTSGTLTIEKTADFRKEQGSVLGKMKSGRYDDYRVEPMMIVHDEIIGGIKGIDVSAWQGVIDWKKVASSGVKFAIIRSSYYDKVDKMFEYNITEAKKAGIYVGVYHYCYALDELEAWKEARFFIDTIKPYEIDFPVMFDFEDNSQIGLGKEKLTRMADIFMGELKNAGYYPMIYSYKNWLTDNLDMDKLSQYETAVAEWDVPKSTYNRSYGIWQYSCKGLVSGIEGDVDLDICYKDYPSIIKKGGWNHLSE